MVQKWQCGLEALNATNGEAQDAFLFASGQQVGTGANVVEGPQVGTARRHGVTACGGLGCNGFCSFTSSFPSVLPPVPISSRTGCIRGGNKKPYNLTSPGGSRSQNSRELEVNKVVAEKTEHSRHSGSICCYFTKLRIFCIIVPFTAPRRPAPPPLRAMPCHKLCQ